MTKPNVVIVDHRNANISSLKNGILNVFECELSVSSVTNDIERADFLILPGVGAFSDSMKDLSEKRIIDLLKEQALIKKKPFLGICLGMQLLFDSSTEGGFHEGLGLIPGKVELLDLPTEFRIPHIGWNDLSSSNSTKIFNKLDDDKNFYFVHSYHVICNKEYVIAEVNYGKQITAAVQKDNIVGFQFHPEKSQRNGMIILNDYFRIFS